MKSKKKNANKPERLKYQRNKNFANVRRKEKRKIGKARSQEQRVQAVLNNKDINLLHTRKP